MSFFQNTCKPKGIGGKIMVNMMNTGHSSMAEWGFTHIEIRNNYICLDIGCGGGANVKRLDIITAFETIYFWPDINEAFKQVYRVLKGSGTFMICNESNGENSKEEKWTKIIQGMKIYNSGQVKKSLEGAGFTDIKIHKNEKGWLCVVCKKDKDVN